MLKNNVKIISDVSVEICHSRNPCLNVNNFTDKKCLIASGDFETNCSSNSFDKLKSFDLENKFSSRKLPIPNAWKCKDKHYETVPFSLSEDNSPGMGDSIMAPLKISLSNGPKSILKRLIKDSQIVEKSSSVLSCANFELSSVKSDIHLASDSELLNRASATEIFHCKNMIISKKRKNFEDAFDMTQLDSKCTKLEQACSSNIKSESSGKPRTKRRRKKELSSDSDEYEVERLDAHRFTEFGECVFQVKWLGWHSIYNSWEPITNLLNCQEKLVQYFNKLLEENKQNEIEEILNFYAKIDLRKTLSPVSFEKLNEKISKYRTKNGIVIPTPNADFIENALYYLSKREVQGEDLLLQEKLKHELLIDKLHKTRKAQLEALKDWELEINFLSESSALITVENKFDLEGPPTNFHYINHYLPDHDVLIPVDPLVGCDCNGCNESSLHCCSFASGSTFAYSSEELLKLQPGQPIYECNNRCSCDINCQNRVIQRGSKVRLCIFRTFNGCGWGVKAMEDIRKGSFVTKYVGEVVTSKEAEKRANSDFNKFYLFDLDFNDNEGVSCPYTVDGSTYGNISHFINHSCDPNLAIYAAWINCLDPNIPQLVLFSTRDIKKGEEVCFSYSRADFRKKKVEVVCKCNANKCRKYVF